MNRFIIISNSGKDPGHQAARAIRDYIMEKGGNGTVLGETVRPECVPEDTQCAIVLGGDGTFIQAACDLLPFCIPILGVNLGTLGFLAEVERQNVKAAVDDLFLDRCRIESRMMLEGVIAGAAGQTALNDIVITRSALGTLNCSELYVNDELIDRYLGDGIIVSTPTGSTAYNLSAGGPILAPRIQAMVVSPICPHSLNKRSLVVSSEDQITIQIGRCRPDRPDEAAAVFDGRLPVKLVSGDRIQIRKARVETKVVKMFHMNFYEILRNKLGKERKEFHEDRQTGENYRTD